MTQLRRPKVEKAKCNNCDERVPVTDLHQVMRKGGGTYNRPPRKYAVRICTVCLDELVARIDPAHSWVLVNRFEPSSFEYAHSRKVVATGS